MTMAINLLKSYQALMNQQ